ncbi:MAG: 6-hydroxymethylpterin diphosphokinase MptE-like protein [Sterolibacterium sp.]
MNEMTQRFAQNMDFLKAEVPALHKLIHDHVCKSELIVEESGAVNIRRADGVMTYKGDARLELEKQVQNFLKTPSRIVVGKPVLVEQEFTEPEPKFGGTWPTSKYDDRPEDFHYQRYLCEASKAIKEAGITVPEEFRGQAYYLFIYGVGAGYQILPLLKQYKPKILLLVDENKDGFVHSTSLIDWKELWAAAKEVGTSIKITVEANPVMLHEAVKGNIMGNSLLGLDGLHVFLHGPSTVLKGVQQMLMDPKSANLASFIGFLTDEYNMMKNSFRNLREGTKRILVNAKEKMRAPVLIIGSGPSLEAHIDKLKEIRDRFIIISSGSSLRVLLTHGIKPDFHCNLERAQSILTRHEELAAEGHDMSDIYAVLTTTIWPGVDKFFKGGAIYFLRPALSPLGVFADNYEQVLFNEGPQVTNTAFAFSRRLAAKEIYLLGVDLGATNPAESNRAVNAWQGIRPRKLTIPIRGNKGTTVFTDMQLIQQRDTLQAQIRKLAEVGGKCYNLGDGARIDGAVPTEIDQLDIPALDFDRKELATKLAEQFPIYTREHFLVNWSNEIVRESVARFCNDLVLKLSAEGWTNNMITEIEGICQYAYKPIRQQYAPRLFRGSLLRMFLHAHGVIQRATEGEERDKAIAIMKAQLERHIRLVEAEAYGLADELESEDPAFAYNNAA